MSKLLDDALEGCSSKIFSTANPQSLAKRELPPGTWSQLYLVYTSHCLAQKQRPACRSVYYKVVKDWRRCLRFRRRSQHSTCGVCDKIKAAMRHSTCFWEHAKQCDAMLAHLSLQWACRRVYWGAREESRKKRGTLAIIIDGYDHSKAMLPRWTSGRTPKGGAFDRVVRPHCNVTCALCHGYGCFVFLSDEISMAGASFQWECILYTVAAGRQYSEGGQKQYLRAIDVLPGFIRLPTGMWPPPLGSWTHS